MTMILDFNISELEKCFEEVLEKRPEFQLVLLKYWNKKSEDYFWFFLTLEYKKKDLNAVDKFNSLNPLILWLSKTK